MPKRFGKALQRVLRRRLKRLERDGDQAIRSGDEDALHAVRIDVKRLRYSLEFAVPIAGKEARDALSLLAHAQERFGALADAVMFGRTYAELLDAEPANSTRRAGLQRLHDDAMRAQTDALISVRALWNGAAGEEPYPDKLRASISETLGSLSKSDDS